MLKKTILAVSIVALSIMSMGQLVTAEPRTINVETVATNSTSGGKNVTTNITAVAGRRVMLWSIYGTSDKSGSVITIDQANATGVTGNYTAQATLAVGAASASFGNGMFPVFIGDTGYALRLRLDSTTKNNIIVNYEYE